MAETNRPFTQEEQAKVSEWSVRIREKHSVPENYANMIDRDRIDKFMAWSEESDFIYVYDEWRTLCKCSYGVVTPVCEEKFDEHGQEPRIRERFWKECMGKRYSIPDGYEVVMFYGENNDIDHWIATCEQRDRIVVKDANDRFFSLGKDGKLDYMPTKEEHIYSLKNDYAKSRQGEDLTQIESDIIAHFIQVVGIVQKSAWYKHESTLQFNMNFDGKYRASMPSLEQVIFALLYIRQLIDDHDNLVNRAASIYKEHSSENVKIKFIRERQRQLESFLKGKPMSVSVAEVVKDNETLVQAFQYGALILHGPENVNNMELREIFKAMYLNKERKAEYIHSLDFTLRNILSLASTISFFIYKDFAEWIAEKKVPAPDVMWQNTMFTWEPIVEAKQPDKNEPPVFGVAYNVEITESKKN